MTVTQIFIFATLEKMLYISTKVDGLLISQHHLVRITMAGHQAQLFWITIPTDFLIFM